MACATVTAISGAALACYTLELHDMTTSEMLRCRRIDRMVLFETEKQLRRVQNAICHARRALKFSAT
ncbi:hypothetical protein L208DRAFT_1396827 [Tricholoma matsutake]|nr:hypothetical protein L208DRAFT_1396827 [Tricholoma matsutake 945]